MPMPWMAIESLFGNLSIVFLCPFLRPAHHLAPLSKAKPLAFSFGPVKIFVHNYGYGQNFASFRTKNGLKQFQSQISKQALKIHLAIVFKL